MCKGQRGDRGGPATPGKGSHRAGASRGEGGGGRGAGGGSPGIVQPEKAAGSAGARGLAGEGGAARAGGLRGWAGGAPGTSYVQRGPSGRGDPPRPVPRRGEGAARGRPPAGRVPPPAALPVTGDGGGAAPGRAVRPLPARGRSLPGGSGVPGTAAGAPREVGVRRGARRRGRPGPEGGGDEGAPPPHCANPPGGEFPPFA